MFKKTPSILLALNHPSNKNKLRSDKLIKASFTILMCLFALNLNRVQAEDVTPEVQAIFDVNCNNGCHTNGNENGGLNLADATTSYAELFEVATTCDANKKRVVDRDSANSVLYAKVIGQPNGCGNVMPPSGNLISATDQAVIRDWIDTLHPNGQVNFSLTSQGPIIGEAGGSITLTVTRGPGQTGDVTVDYATADGTATAGLDYVADSGTLAFADGQTSQTIVITILDDALIEGDENFFVNLSNVTGGVTLGPSIRSTVTIADDDDPPSPGVLLMNNVSLNINENTASTDIVIRRAAGNEGAVSVMLTSADGSATSGQDYQAISTVVSFANGENMKSIPLVVMDDQIFEGNETLSLSLSSPTGGASIGSPSTTAVTIVENDPDPNAGSGGSGGGSGGGGTTTTPTNNPGDGLQPEKLGSIFWLLLLLPFIGLYRRKSVKELE